MDPITARDALTAPSGWFKSSYSGGQNGCVELNLSIPGHAGVRDSKLGDASPVLVVTARQMTTFLNVVKNTDSRSRSVV